MVLSAAEVVLIAAGGRLNLDESLKERIGVPDGGVPVGRIMIVDPSLLDRKRMRSVVEAAGHRVMEAAGPAEALAALRSLPPGTVRLIMTEMQFPGEDGREFIQALRSDPVFKQLPTVVVAPQLPRETVIDLIAGGIATIVTKPFSGDMLLRRVTETLSDVNLLNQGEGSLLSWTTEDYLRRELRRTDRNGSHFSLLVVKVLDLMEGQGVPLLMRGLVRHMRESDVLARMGDDQVVILLPETDSVGAAAVVKRVVQTAQSILGEQTGGHPLSLTVKVGAATYPSEAGDVQSLLEMARERVPAV